MTPNDVAFRLLTAEAWFTELKHRLAEHLPDGPAKTDALLALDSAWSYTRSSLEGADQAQKEYDND